LILINGRPPSVENWNTLFLAAYLSDGHPTTIYNGTSTISDIESGRQRTLDQLLNQLHGRRPSNTLGAEENPAWVKCRNLETKGQYLKTLKWMQSNRGKIPLEIFPDPTDTTPAIKGKYREFSKRFHPDVNPGGSGFFAEGVKHWKLMLKMSPEANRKQEGLEDPVTIHIEIPRRNSAQHEKLMRLVQDLQYSEMSFESIRTRIIETAGELGIEPETFLREVT